MVISNRINETGLEQIDPNAFRYDQFKEIALQNGIQISDITNALHINKDSPRKAAQRNGGIIDAKFYYVLVGLVAMKRQSRLIIKESQSGD